MILQRGRYRYLHPDRNRGITEKALGTDYGMEHLEKRFLQMKKGSSQNTEQLHIILSRAITTKIQLLSFYYRTHLRLVVDLQTNVKAMQSEAYARKVKITNLQQMANTLIYIQEHGYDTRENLSKIIFGDKCKTE